MGAGDVECLPSMREALRSIPITVTKKGNVLCACVCVQKEPWFIAPFIGSQTTTI